MLIREELGMSQFEHVNAMREYPFAEGSSILDRKGRELPRDLLVDAHFVIPSEFGNPDSGFEHDEGPVVRMSSAHISPQMVSVCFIAEKGVVRSAMSVTVARSAFRPYFPYRLEKLDGYENCGGIVTFGDFTFPGFPETYFLTGAEIHPCCIAVSRPASLRRFVDPRSGESVTGDARIEFSGHVGISRVGNAFSLSLDNGSESELASECAYATGRDVCGATPIRSINGIRPDSDGNIVLWFH